MKQEGTEAKVIAGELLEDTKRLAELTMLPTPEDEAKEHKANEDEAKASSKRCSKRAKKSPVRLSQADATPNRPSKRNKGGDITESDDDLDVEQRCAACSGVFNYFTKDDCTRYRCFRCDDGGLLLCKVCVVEHRAKNTGHRCRKRTKPQLKAKPSRGSAGKLNGGRKGGKPVNPDNQEQSGAAAAKGGKRPQPYSVTDEADFVKTYERRRELYAPAYHATALAEQHDAQTKLMQSKIHALEMQIRMEELERKLKASRDP
jgi:hypothetical protein